MSGPMGGSRTRGRRWIGVLLGLALVSGAPLRAQETEPGEATPDDRYDTGLMSLTEVQQRQLQELERRFLDRVSEALELSEEQRQRLEATLRESRAQRLELVQQRTVLREELDLLIAEPNPDQETIQQLLDRRSTLDERQVQIGRTEEERLGEFMSPVQTARFMYLRQKMVQALRDRVRQVARPQAGERPRRPAASDRPRVTDEAGDRALRPDGGSATPVRDRAATGSPDRP